jgi:hypothetical protein
VVAGRVGAAFDAALVGQAALALQEELLPFAAALLALGTGVSSQLSVTSAGRPDPRSDLRVQHHASPLNAAPLARAAAVVGLRSDVLDAGDLQASGLE